MSDIVGDLKGIRRTTIKELEQIYEESVPVGQIVTSALAEKLARFTTELNREIAVYLNRKGTVTKIAVGDNATVSLPETEGRRSIHRLCGIRCIHTHPNGNSELSGVDIASLKQMRYDAMVALGISNNQVTNISIAFIIGLTNDEYDVGTIGPIDFAEIAKIDLLHVLNQIERSIGNASQTVALKQTEKAFLVGLDTKNSEWDINDSLDELMRLAETAGAEVIGRTYQKREKPDAAFFIGRGKVQEISLLCQQSEANMVIFDDELSPAQQRNLEQMLGIKVLDRTGLILDIFAQRARSHEGKLQVELAQLKYNLPRLGGQGLILSRLGGGIGTRGPGETKLEVDKRRIRAKINDIENEIENFKKHRNIQRSKRAASMIPTVSLVGYTNAGKSTLLNTLSGADVLAEDKLFATLDPTTKRIVMPGGQDILLTDTVGFIQKLPHNLVAAFRATLEEVIQADVLLHVVDASHPQYENQITAVVSVLRELKVDNKPTIVVFNKVDNIDNPYLIERLRRVENSVNISAVNKQGLTELYSAITKLLSSRTSCITLLIPYEHSKLIAELYTVAKVQSTEYREDGILAHLVIQNELKKKYENYQIGEDV